MVKNTSDRWAIMIGISQYHESLGTLKYSVNDCRRLAEVLTTGDDAFPTDHVLVLADDEAAARKPTYANIHSWLASWLAQPDEDDTVVVFFAGHGREMDGKCYIVPCDASLQTIHVTGIPVPYVQGLLNRCRARQKVLILDACHSGAGRDVATMAAPMMKSLSAGKGIYTLSSCDVDELSHEWDEKKQGVFSYYLAEALSGSCLPDAHGRITAEAVYDWVFSRVQTWARGNRCSQTPKRICDVSGVITLRAGRPDWRFLTQTAQKELLQSEQTVAEMRQKLLTKGRELTKSLEELESLRRQKANAQELEQRVQALQRERDELRRENRQLTESLTKLKSLKAQQVNAQDLEQKVKTLQQKCEKLRQESRELGHAQAKARNARIRAWTARNWTFPLVLGTSVMGALLAMNWSRNDEDTIICCLVEAGVVWPTIGLLGLYGRQWGKELCWLIGIIAALLWFVIGLLSSVYGRWFLLLLPGISLAMLIPGKGKAQTSSGA